MSRDWSQSRMLLLATRQSWANQAIVAFAVGARQAYVACAATARQARLECAVGAR